LAVRAATIFRPASGHLARCFRSSMRVSEAWITLCNEVGAFTKGAFMRQHWGEICWLSVILLTGCAASQGGQSTAVRPAAMPPESLRPAVDRILTPGDVQVAEGNLRTLGFDPGPVDGHFTAETQAAIRAFQDRYGIPSSGLFDYATRQELLPGLDPKPGP
jgi:hypothetical protein